MSAQAESGVRVLVRRTNGRLHDPERERSVTVEEVAELIRGGAKVKVVDGKTGDDLTRRVLTQVILEEQERLDMLPIELLHLIIRTQGTVQAEPLKGFLAQALKHFAAFGDAWSRHFAAWMDAAGAGDDRKGEARRGEEADERSPGAASPMDQWLRTVQTAARGLGLALSAAVTPPPSRRDDAEGGERSSPPPPPGRSGQE